MSGLAAKINQSKGILPGFENIHRFHNRQLKMDMVKILPGEFYVTKMNEVIATVLGSCVSVCISDKKAGVGGMNHFMLPEGNDHSSDNWRFNQAGKAARYGVDAMEHLINEILKHGGKKNNLVFKICGGGKIMSNMNDIGSKNINFIRRYLDTEGYGFESEDVGDIYPRKVRYFPLTGKLQVMKLKSLHNNTIIEREDSYKHKLEKEPVTGDVELF